MASRCHNATTSAFLGPKGLFELQVILGPRTSGGRNPLHVAPYDAGVKEVLDAHAERSSEGVNVYLQRRRGALLDINRIPVSDPHTYTYS